MNDRRRYLLIAVIAFLAALVGVLVGRAYLSHEMTAEAELHALLHDQLELDADQHARIELIERHFALRKQALERAMHADNARLAEAIAAEHGYGPLVSATVDRSHQAMGRLQKETLEHIFAMRA
ncbi:MAG: periplasmic heavy metal sensor, partial [Sphingomonadales bacterium]